MQEEEKFESLVQRRWKIFKKQKISYFSLQILLVLYIFALAGNIICNEKPLWIYHEGRHFFPFLIAYSEADFGGFFPTEPDYNDPELLKLFEKSGTKRLLAPLGFGPESIDFHLNAPAPSPPDSRHILGTDDRARDVFARLVFGFRISLTFALLLSLLSTFIGTIFGAIQGYFAGRIDLFGQRIIEIWSSLPELFILIIMTSLFKSTLTFILFLMAFMGWMGLSYYVRAEFLRLRQSDFVQSAKALGAGPINIMARHIFPNALTPIITFFPFRVASGITALASLDFLGLGLPPPTPSLGELLAQGKANLHSWWIILASFFVLALTILLLNFIGDGVQKAMDPKSILVDNSKP